MSTGRRAIGLAQGLGPGYPFAQAYPTRDLLLADFYLAYEDPADYNDELQAFVPPLQLVWVHGLDTGASGTLPGWTPTPTHTVDVLVKDANGAIVFDSTVASYYHYTAFTDRLAVYEWRSDVDTCRLVAHVGWGVDDTVVTYPAHLFPAFPNLDPTTYHRRPKRVRKITALLTDITQGDIEICAGYNTDLVTTSAPVGDRTVNNIEIDFVPGAGLGVYADCSAQEVSHNSINGVQADANGDLQLVGTGCVNIYEPTTIVGATAIPTQLLNPMAPQLMISDNCPPCCSCDDYLAEAEDLLSVRNQYAGLGDMYRQIRELYANNVDRWNFAKQCAQNQPLRLIMQAQNCPYVDVAAQFCNQTARCRRDVKLRLRFAALPNLVASCYPASNETTEDPFPLRPITSSSPPVAVVAGSTYITTSVPRGLAPYTVDGSWCDYRAYFDSVNPFESVYVRFRLQFPDAGLSGGKPYAIQGILDAIVDGEWLAIPDGSKAAASQAVSLRCPQSTSPLVSPSAPTRQVRTVSSVVSVDVHFDSAATLPIRIVPGNALIEQITIFVDASFDGDPHLAVGISSDHNRYAGPTRSYLTDPAATRFDIYPALPPDLSPQSLIITYDRGGATTGTARVVVRYSA